MSRESPRADFDHWSMGCFGDVSILGFLHLVRKTLRLFRQVFAARPDRMGLELV